MRYRAEGPFEIGMFLTGFSSERFKGMPKGFRGSAFHLAARVFGRQDASSGKNPLKETVTIILLPNDSTRGKHFMIPLRAYKAAVTRAIPLCIAFLYVIVDYSTMAVRVSETYKLPRRTPPKKSDFRPFRAR